MDPLGARLAAIASELTALPSRAGQLGAQEVALLIERIAALTRTAEAALIALGTTAVDTGAVAASTAVNPTQWLIERGLPTRSAIEVAQAVDVCRDPDNGRIQAAVYAGELTARGAVITARETDKLLTCLPHVERDTLIEHYIAHTPDGRGDLRRLAQRLLAVHGGDQCERNVQRQHDLETLSWHHEPTGMWSLTALLAPDHAAHLKAAISALTAPRRLEGNAAPDPRTAGKRRVDALISLVTRAMTSDPDQAPSSPATQMIVTVDYALLRGGIGGFGTTTTDRDLDAGTLRRLACDSDIIPLVLGGASQPLDVGRTRRLATPAQRAALTVRDRGCTFPGCDRPPGWCIAHHFTHWLQGGPTTMENLGLLCERHHVIVHRDGYTATIRDNTVCWHPPDARRDAA